MEKGASFAVVLFERDESVAVFNERRLSMRGAHAEREAADDTIERASIVNVLYVFVRRGVRLLNVK